MNTARFTLWCKALIAVAILLLLGLVASDSVQAQVENLPAIPSAQPSPASLLTDIEAISTRGYHTCALTTGGGVKCWGYNSSGQVGDRTLTNRLAPVNVNGLSNGVRAIAAGGYHTCALTTGGGVKCWGDNWSGQLGDGTMTNSLMPVDVSGLSSGLQAIAAGGHHTCALTIGGGVKCWGGNKSGQLGDGTTTDRQTPVNVSGLSSGVRAIAAGWDHTCALTIDGVKCWGDNGSGRLGDGTTTGRLTPVDVTDLVSDVQAIAAGYSQTCALTATGGVKCWGDSRLTPVDVNGLSSGVQAITAGNSHACALISDGVKCWGDNGIGELGDGTLISRSTPVDVSGLASGVQAIAAGGGHTCALTTGGGVKCWGDNYHGQLGDGTGDSRLTPVDVTSLTSGVQAITGGGSHTCALTTDSGIKCWGDNSGGQLGDGTMTDHWMPMDVSSLSSGVQAVAAGWDHTCALTEAGGVKCWGSNGNGQLGDGTDNSYWTPMDVSGLTSDVRAITTGVYYTCAVTSSGGVKCWGANWIGQLGDGTLTNRLTPVDVSGLSSGVRAIAASHGHTCALTTGGGVKCWGSNSWGQLGDGTTINRPTPVDVNGLSSGVKAIAAGDSYTCALTTPGGVKCWGDNSAGRLGDGTSTYRLTPVDVSGLSNGVQAIAAGGGHTCALITSGGAKCWGWNGNGQLGDGTRAVRWTPVEVNGLTSDVRAITLGWWDHTCALTTGGGVKCWGRNGDGQLGIDPGLTPVDVIAGTPTDPAVTEPVVFIPGIGGSRIKGPNDLLDLWPNFLAADDLARAALLIASPIYSQPELIHALLEMERQAWRLTRDPAASAYDPNLYAVDVVRKALGVKDTYDSFLRNLVNNGYTEYVLPTDVNQLPGFGCNKTQSGSKPTLFVFPYDWRRSNAENAVLLKNYINDCVLFYHPGNSVNIVTHSMGGLLARRYILDDPNNSHIKRLISIAAPWLGSPKLINVLESGDFDPMVNFLLINRRVLKDLVRTFPGAHELLPSKGYFDLGGEPMAESGDDDDDDGRSYEFYDFNDFTLAITRRYGAQIAPNNITFHNNQGQDEWALDTLAGVEYHHIYGIKKKSDTIKQVKFTQVPACVLVGIIKVCVPVDAVDIAYGNGDGTVPLLSALRSVSAPAPMANIQFHRLVSPQEEADDGFEHGGMVQNSDLQRCVIDLLRGDSCEDPIVSHSLSNASVLSATDDEALDTASAYYLTIIGSGDGYVTDSAGNATGMLHEGAVFVDQVPNVTFDSLGSNGFSIVAPLIEQYTVTLRSGETPLLVQIEKGVPDAIDQAVHYQDVVVPANTLLELHLPLAADTSGLLLYDSNGDDVVDQPVPQTPIIATGPAAADTQPPTVTVASTADRVVIIAAEDWSGVQAIYYSFDGSNFQPYTAPVSAPEGATAVYAFADDLVGNRSALVSQPMQAASTSGLYLPLIHK